MRVAIFVLPLAAILLSVAAPVRGGSETLKIGILVDLTGRVSYLGSLSRAVAEMARDDLKREGKEVELVFEDSASDTLRSVSAVKKLIAGDNIEALYTETTPIAAAVAPAMADAKRLMLYSSLGESILKQNPYVLKTFVDAASMCKILASYFSIQPLKVGVLKPTIEPGELCAEGAHAAQSAALILPYSINDTVQSQVITLRSRGIQAVINAAGYEGDMLNMLKAMKDISYAPALGTTCNNVTEHVRRSFPAALEQFVVVGIRQKADALIERIRQNYPLLSLAAVEQSIMLYTHIRQMTAAGEKCPEKGGACMVEKMKEMKADLLSGFKGFNGQKAEFELQLRKWDGTAFADIPAKD